MAGLMAADPDLRRRVFFGSRPNFREEEKKVAGGFFFVYRRPTFAGGVFILWDVDFLRRQRFLQDIDWKGGYFLQEADVRRKIFFRKQILTGGRRFREADFSGMSFFVRGPIVAGG